MSVDAPSGVSASDGWPLEGAWAQSRLLVVSADPFAVLDLISELEALGAEPAVLFDFPAEQRERPDVVLLDADLAGVDLARTVQFVADVEKAAAGQPPALVLLHGDQAAPVVSQLRDHLAAGDGGEPAGSGVTVLAAEGAVESVVDLIREHLAGVDAGRVSDTDSLAVEPLSAPVDRAALEAPVPTWEMPVVLAPAGAPEVVETAPLDGPPEREAPAARVGSGMSSAPAPAPTVHPELAGDWETDPSPVGSPDSGRLLRAVLTVLVVTAILWFVFSRLQATPSGAVMREMAQQVSGRLGGASGDQGTQQRAAVDSATAELSGRVIRSDTGGSIGGATVIASGPTGPIATVTDAQGRFRLSGLKGGRYVIVGSVPRFVSRQLQVVVPEGGSVEDVHLRLDPEGS
jgi:hypothetical protein